jgi:hypothetical protein
LALAAFAAFTVAARATVVTPSTSPEELRPENAAACHP